MAVDFASAVSAYKSAAGMFAQSATAGAPALPDENPGQGASFTGLVRDALQSTIQAGKESETLTRQAIEGKADLREVVMAVNNAETTLQTVIAVRDKVVSAYETILRMPI
ncbi:flagellar hook-basal body complex protein FliE [Pararhodospirillum oryzae]|uniref:Flagellar hook-basal body complex protein FliE n=1 Tax=Pararhodospirillum oryzae TaxID=478448 RepID=A0A512H4D1_9PROT|nr:flagellar hook-basal body complex protein FliE [Pararhodospirillum oryzae]GEO80297.1 flagellar hook-basal body complex protein FliE [Pararhodospirillum oryzae]